MFEDRLGYNIEEEEHVELPVRVRRVGVYVAGEENPFDPTLLSKEITAENAVVRAAELETACVALEKQLQDLTETNRRVAEE